MRVHNFAYLFRTGIKNIFYNKLMSFACIGVLVACLLLIGSSMLFTITINNMATDVESQNEVVVFLDTRLTMREVEAVDVSLRAIPNIIGQRFISKEQGLEEEKEKMGDLGQLLAGLEGADNPLPDKYVLRIADSSRIDETLAQINAIGGVDYVNASIEVAHILTGIRNTVYYAGAAVVIILVVVSLVIITNTIKLTVFSRRREIQIMKFVGATDSFIRLPFLVEGTLIGLIAAFFAFVMLGVGYTYLIEWAKENYMAYFALILNNTVDFTDIALEIMIGFSAVGVLIGVLSSGFFVRKHLRV
ncbi:MAG: permease-like cell division protein FtsX [Oscillospiraceae bacterium]|nr:permease-like cell division protein FtsX [Oscillospiraceae bacterium]